MNINTRITATDALATVTPAAITALTVNDRTIIATPGEFSPSVVIIHGVDADGEFFVLSGRNASESEHATMAEAAVEVADRADRIADHYLGLVDPERMETAETVAYVTERLVPFWAAVAAHFRSDLFA